ncbi:MAG: hypothetical protein CM1200mP20_14140 [Pseudomonadota bacterium]|nr:MAG: hypothetical protein CM1200mP20_14140 [Pseudomonadota bacterium]
MRIRLSSFLFVVAGLVTASATADGANFEISTPTAGIQLQTGQKTTLEWDNWKLHKGPCCQATGKPGARRLKYQRDDHRNLEGFITACRTDCESGVADGTKGSCGGFVVNYSSGSSRKTPRYCVFKTEGASPYSRKSKDFHEYRLNLNKNISIELVRVNDRGVQEESYSIKSEDCQQNFGNCTWQVPDNASEGNYQISVRNTGTPVGTVLKSAEFLIVKTKLGEDSKTNQSTQNQDKPVEYSGGPGRVLIPKRSQQWHAGSTVQIEWNFKKYSGPVDIYLSQEYRDSGVEAKKNWIVLKKHGVKGQGTGAKRFNFRESRDGDLEGFITACKKRCESGRANGKNGSCGGFVVNYSPGSEKKKPQHCVFKLAGVRPYKKNTKDFYVWIAPKRIAESVANTGHYRWTIHQNTPAGTRQRISVVPTKGDLAGIQSDEFALKKWVKSERLRGRGLALFFFRPVESPPANTNVRVSGNKADPPALGRSIAVAAR